MIIGRDGDGDDEERIRAMGASREPTPAERIVADRRRAAPSLFSSEPGRQDSIKDASVTAVCRHGDVPGKSLNRAGPESFRDFVARPERGSRDSRCRDSGNHGIVNYLRYNNLDNLGSRPEGM